MTGSVELRLDHAEKAVKDMVTLEIQIATSGSEDTVRKQVPMNCDNY